MLTIRFALTVVMLVLVNWNLSGQDLTRILIDGRWCNQEGTAVSEAEKQLNRNKNRFNLPLPGDIDATITLKKMLQPGTDVARFDSSRAAIIEGYVVDVVVGGCSTYSQSQGETCNCNTIDPKICDTHIVVGLEPGVHLTKTIIVEVTERMRLLHKSDNWSTDSLRVKLKNKYVQFVGWLTFDFSHINEASNTNPGNPKNWRATCWELHPVTDFALVK